MGEEIGAILEQEADARAVAVAGRRVGAPDRLHLRGGLAVAAAKAVGRITQFGRRRRDQKRRVGIARRPFDEGLVRSVHNSETEDGGRTTDYHASGAAAIRPLSSLVRRPLFRYTAPCQRRAPMGVPHPMRGPNKFKLGVFSANSDGGLALTRVPERWPARWSEIVEVAQMADRAGIEFFLPIARWKGFGGELNSREWSYETFTFAAALAAVTEQIALFSTVHVPMVHPVYAAKALTTVDHAANGRAGLNIVCGWNPEEFALFGLPMIEDRYAQGLEWFEIMSRIYSEP